VNIRFDIVKFLTMFTFSGFKAPKNYKKPVIINLKFSEKFGAQRGNR